MKRIVSLMLVIAMLLTAFPAVAAEVAYSGTCGGDVRWELTTDGVLTVSGEGPMDDEGCYWSACENQVKQAVVLDGVTRVGDYAFEDCYHMTSIELADSVTEIGEEAFYCCEELTEVHLGSGLQTIEAYAFEECYSLEEIAIPDSVTVIETYAFRDCEELTTVKLGSGVSEIGYRAFYRTNIDTVIYNGTRRQFDAIMIDSSNTDLTDAMIFCTDTVLSGNCGPKLTWSFDADKGALTIDGSGTMFDYDNTYATKRVPWYDLRNVIDMVYLPNGITRIGSYAFAGTNIRRATVPDSVTSIGDHAFEACGDMTAVKFGSSLTSIGIRAFADCDGLTAVELPMGLEQIGEHAFAWCTGLLTAEIPNSVTSLGASAFLSCSALRAVSLPEGVAEIPEQAFLHCEMLQRVTIPETVKKIGSYAFSWCDSLSSVTIPVSVTQVDADAFAGCSGLFDVYYEGTAAQWEQITVERNNEPLLYADLHTACDGAEVLCTYTAAAFYTHTVVKVCADCGGTVYSALQACIDENDDGLCDLCAASVVCLHGKANSSYIKHGDGTHTVTAYCSICGEVVFSDIVSCSDSNGDARCDLCGGMLGKIPEGLDGFGRPGHYPNENSFVSFVPDFYSCDTTKEEIRAFFEDQDVSDLAYVLTVDG